MKRVFVGVDERQWLAFTVAAHSLLTHSSVPVAITPLLLDQLPLHRKGLTTFTFSRYLVPYLCNFEGSALFMDADVLVRGDIAELPWDQPDSVAVVPHDTVQVKGKTVKVRFERPSVMLFNCAKCTKLTLEYIETGSPQSFDWADSVGELPRAWNHLVGYDTPRPDACLAHFTQGIPAFSETEHDEYAQEWREALQGSMGTVDWGEIMGGSVHAQFKTDPVKQFLSPFGKLA